MRGRLVLIKSRNLQIITIEGRARAAKEKRETDLNEKVEESRKEGKRANKSR